MGAEKWQRDTDRLFERREPLRDTTRTRRDSGSNLLERHFSQLQLGKTECKENRRPQTAQEKPKGEWEAKERLVDLQAPMALPKRSGLQKHLEQTGGLEGTVAPLIDDVLLTMHKAEKKLRSSAGHLEQHVNLEHRRKVVAWLVKAFHVVSFDDHILYGTIQLADLYLSACPKYVCGSILQSVVMACVCTTLKLATPDHRVYSVPDLIAHITHSQITLDRVLRVEREVLTGLDFNVSTPTIAQFLETFSVRLTGPQFDDWAGMRTVPPLEAVVGGPAVARPKFYHLADYICQLALLNHELLDFLPSELASGALVLAVWSMRGPAPLKAILLEDVRVFKTNELQAVVRALHKEWLCPSDREASIAVVEKFATLERQEVSEWPPLGVMPLV